MKPKERKCILVVGMHRSGTSALAGALQVLGLDLGDKLLEANEHNQKGYFEHRLVYQLNEDILDALGVNWHASYLLTEGWHKSVVALSWVDKIADFLRGSFVDSSVFALKDPRLSILLPLWYMALEKEKIEYATVISIRHPLEVAKSLAIPHPQIDFKAILLWIDYNLKIEKYSRDTARTYVGFDHLVKRPKNLIEIVRKLIPGFNFNTLDKEKELTTFLERDLQHQIAPSNSSERYGHSEALELWSLLQSLEHGETAEIIKQWDRFYQLHKDILEDYGKVYQRSQGEQVHFLQQSNQKMSQDLQILSDRSADFEIEVSSFKSQITNLNGEIISLQEQNTGYRTKVEEHELELKDKVARVAHLEVELEIRNDDLVGLKQRTKEYDDQISELANRIGALTLEIEQQNKALVQEGDDKKRRYEIMLQMIGQIERYRAEKLQKIAEIETQLAKERQGIMEFQDQNLKLRKHAENLSRDNSDLRSSFSFRLGWVLTRPLAFILRPFTSKNQRSGNTGFFQPFLTLIRRPTVALKMINGRNFQILLAALRKEPVSQIIRNFQKAIENTNTILLTKKSPDDLLFSIDMAHLVNNSLIVIKGWIVTNETPLEVQLLSNDGFVAAAVTGEERAHVADVHPNYRNSLTSGFSLKYNLTESLSVADLQKMQLSFRTGEKVSVLDLNLEPATDYGSLNLNEQYQVYRDRNQLTNDKLISLKIDREKFTYTPKISIVTPVYNVDPKWLDLCIDSVVNQIYQNWELCLYDDASTNPKTVECLKKWSNTDDRIKVKIGKENKHISEASNNAINMATGEFIALLDNDDEITPDALYEVVKVMNSNRNLDFIYSDEDKITLAGELVDPHFKPDWSPETMESMMYTCHLAVFRKKLLNTIGGFRKGFEGSQDYDLVLRFTEQTKKIFHIPKILYHWRMIPGSAAASTDAKGYAYEAAVKALQSKLTREGAAGQVEHGKWLGSYRLRREHNSPRVSIIIPFRDQVEITLACLKSIFKSTYQNYEVILVSNQSSESSISRIKDAIRNNPGVTLYEYNFPFNYSKINNWAVQKTTAEYVLFLNNDTKVITHDWIESMLEFATKKDIGAVGAKLLYEDKTVQHAGVILGIVGIGNHAFRHQPHTNHGYFGYANVVRNCSAVTGACLLVARNKFLAVGGFDEINLKVAYNDIDLCLKLLEKGYRNIYTPYAELFHFESRSRGSDVVDVDKQKRFKEEVLFFKERWASMINQTDPYYSPNLTLAKEDFSLNLEVNPN